MGCIYIICYIKLKKTGSERAVKEGPLARDAESDHMTPVNIQHGGRGQPEVCERFTERNHAETLLRQYRNHGGVSEE